MIQEKVVIIFLALIATSDAKKSSKGGGGGDVDLWFWISFGVIALAIIVYGLCRPSQKEGEEEDAKDTEINQIN